MVSCTPPTSMGSAMKCLSFFIFCLVLSAPAAVQARAVYFCYCISDDYVDTEMEQSARTGIEEIVAARATEPLEPSLHTDAVKRFAQLKRGGFTMAKLKEFSDDFGFALFIAYDPHIQVKRTGGDGQLDIVTISLDVKATDALKGKIIGSQKASWTFTINKGIQKPAKSPAVARAMRATAKELTKRIVDSKSMMMWLLTH